MKTFKVLVCALFVLCGGLMFAACGGEKQDFDVNKIIVGTIDEFVYDGTNHVVEINYEGVDASITYALEDNKNVFLPISQLPTKNVGTYNVYYKLSSKGYNDYVSSGTIEFTVVPRTLEIINDDFVWIKNVEDEIKIPYLLVGLVEGDDVNLQCEIQDFDKASAQYGKDYDINFSINNSNYDLVNETKTLIVKNYVDLCDAEGNVVGYYSNIQEAINNAEEGQTVVLNKDLSVNQTINVNKSIKIDGLNEYSIYAAEEFTGYGEGSNAVKSVFHIEKENVNLTLKDIVINGAQVVRGVSAFAGNVTIDGATITNGNKTDKWRSGGVFITNSATFNMTSGTIVGNNASDEEYTKYCADLWIGANAQGLVNSSITGGVVGNVFVNSNSYSATDAGKFTLNGGTIENIYVEYDSHYGATFEYVTGKINNLMVSLLNDGGNYYGVYETLTPVEGRTYKGGQLVYTEDNLNSAKENSVHYEGINISDIDSKLIDGNSYIFENCTFSGLVTSNKHVEIVFNDCRFLDANGTANLKLTCVENLVVNNCLFEGTTNGIAIDIALINANCDNVIITNNDFKSTSNVEQNVAISIKVVKNTTQSQVSGKLSYAEIGGNKFTESNNAIYIGDDPQDGSTAVNAYSGNFNVLVADNLTDLVIYNKFRDKNHLEYIVELPEGNNYSLTKSN